MKMRLCCVAAALFVVVACDQNQTGSQGDSASGALAEAPQAGHAPSADSLAPAPVIGAPQADAAGPAPLSLGNGVLNYPDDLQVIMLVYRVRGLTPPIETWASNVQTVRYADEFSRPQRLQTEMQRLQAAYDSTADVGIIQVRTTAQLSEYDAGAGGFYVSALQPGTALYFNSFEFAALNFDNASAAHVWRLAPAAAQDAFERNRRLRDVRVDITARIVGVDPHGDRPTLHGRVLSYSVRSYDSSIGPLGAQDVARD
jgi:hypothetical protein